MINNIEVPKLAGAADVKKIGNRVYAYVELVWNTTYEKCMITKTFLSGSEEPKNIKVHGTGYIDEDVVVGEEYEYVVRAVAPADDENEAEREGKNSNVVRISVNL